MSVVISLQTHSPKLYTPTGRNEEPGQVISEFPVANHCQLLPSINIGTK